MRLATTPIPREAIHVQNGARSGAVRWRTVFAVDHFPFGKLAGRPRMGRAMVDLNCNSFQKAPKRIMLDIDDTSDAAHQARRARRRDEDNDQESFANVVPKPADSAPRADAHPAPRHVKSRGAAPPKHRTLPDKRQTFFRPPFGSPSKKNGRAKSRAKVILRHPSEAVFEAKWLKPCIKRVRARCFEMEPPALSCRESIRQEVRAARC
jgi:hypothetical protein